ncbi:hypothetical protein S83_040328, partial [Arachis hypogaea]
NDLYILIQLIHGPNKISSAAMVLLLMINNVLDKIQGESETFFQKAIQQQGRAAIMDTMQEIQE